MGKVEITEYTRGAEIGEDCADIKVSQEDYECWEDSLKDMGYVIMPLIERGGACILLADPLKDKIGLLLKYPGTGSQFEPHTGCCQALTDSDNTVAKVFFKDVLKSIIPVGTEMWLNMGAIQGRGGSTSSPGRLHVRLSVPQMAVPTQGKVYVVAAYKPPGSRHPNSPAESMVLEVNPWDLQLGKHEGDTGGVQWLE